MTGFVKEEDLKGVFSSRDIFLGNSIILKLRKETSAGGHYIIVEAEVL